MRPLCVPRPIVLLPLCLLTVACTEPAYRQAQWTVLGEPATAELYMATERDAELAEEKIKKAMAAVEATMSYNLPGSELALINERAADGYHQVQDRDLYRTLLLALDYAKASHGRFDPTVGPLMRLYGDGRGRLRVPRQTEIDVTLGRVGWRDVQIAPEARAIRFRVPGMLLDLGGVAEGFALDAAIRAFARPGSRGGLLRVGNSLYAWGHPPDSDSWSVPVPDPRHPGQILIRVRATARGIAVTAHRSSPVSEGDDALHLLLDSETGQPSSSGILAAVALADSGADADALSTALFLSGFSAASDLLTRTRRVEAVLLVDGDEGPYLLASASLQGRLELPPEIEAETGGRTRYLLPPTGM